MSNCEWCGEHEEYIKENSKKIDDRLCGACLNFHEQGITYEELLTGKYKEGSDELIQRNRPSHTRDIQRPQGYIATR